MAVDTSSPYLFGTRDSMMPLHVDPGVSPQVERPGSQTLSGGGVRRGRAGKRAARGWDFNLSMQTPDAVAGLELAAAGLLGDVWLLDQDAASLNMLFDHQVAGSELNPRLSCGGFALRSYVSGGTTQQKVTVSAVQDAYVYSSAPYSNYARSLYLAVSSTETTLLQFILPPAPEGMISFTAQLVGGVVTGTPNPRVRRSTTDWSETTVSWSNAPTQAGAIIGQINSGAGPGRANLTLANADLSTMIGLALTHVSSDGAFRSRRDTSGPPFQLEIMFQVAAPTSGNLAVSSTPVRAGIEYTLSGYTNATAGTICEWALAGGASGLVSASPPPPIINLVQNPRLSGGLYPPGWSSWGTSDCVTAFVPGPRAGSRAFQVTPTRDVSSRHWTGYAEEMADPYTAVPVTPGQTYTASMGFRVVEDPERANPYTPYLLIGIFFYDSYGQLMYTSEDQAPLVYDDAWYVASKTAEITPGVAFIGVAIGIDYISPSFGLVLQVAEPIVTLGPDTVPYFDGANAPGSGWASWLGAVDSSASRWEPTATDHTGRWSRKITPASNTVLSITVPKNAAGLVAGIGLAEGDPGGKFHPGKGTPCRVQVSDPQPTKKGWVKTDSAHADYSVHISESGIQGVV